MDEDRDARVRTLWWSSIRELDPGDARAALLQAMLDIAEHWATEHSEDGLPEDLGIPPDEYLTTLIRRVRDDPPTEARDP